MEDLERLAREADRQIEEMEKAERQAETHRRNAESLSVLVTELRAVSGAVDRTQHEAAMAENLRKLEAERAAERRQNEAAAERRKELDEKRRRVEAGLEDNRRHLERLAARVSKLQGVDTSAIRTRLERAGDNLRAEHRKLLEAVDGKKTPTVEGR